MTPAWAAEALVARYFGNLGAADLVLEPSCGTGAFLQAVPEAVRAIGVDIDPALAEAAAQATGRRVVGGDFRTVRLDVQPTVILGNPPYEIAVIEGFLARARHLLPDTGRCGFLLPAYAVQTHRRVLRWHATWSMTAEIVPRRLFPRLRLPLVFVVFTKERVRTLVGFALYPEAVAFDNLAAPAKLALIAVPRRPGVWRALVEDTLARLGGRATLAALYQAIEPRRPTPNAWWREKVRQTLQRYCTPLERGVWALAS
jgi:site-specific DNA-methyltransferase (adenine-specific)